ncbi:MAG: hypothetical protein ACE10G_13535 [Gemmatimonadales bacterium]
MAVLVGGMTTVAPRAWASQGSPQDDGLGYSPLDQITPANVDELRLAWVWTMEQGRVQRR